MTLSEEAERVKGNRRIDRQTDRQTDRAMDVRNIRTMFELHQATYSPNRSVVTHL